jgi:hypothetical protein
MGRNGRKSAAPATLNMFPKFELVLVRIYFMVLPKVFLPSNTPSASTVKSFLDKIISADSFATSTALSTDMPTSQLFRDGASLIPSPCSDYVAVTL